MSKTTKKVIKYGLNIALILLITWFALHMIFKDNEPEKIIEQIKKAKPGWLILATVLMFLFATFESFILKYLFDGLKQKISYVKCFFLAWIEFFYSQITPGASGGQPVQIYYMGKCGINGFVSTMVCMLVTLTYKFMLVILCLVFIILRPALTIGAIEEVIALFIFGVIFQAGFATFLLVAIIKPAFASWIINTLIKWGIGLRIIRHPDKIISKANESLKQYDQASVFIRQNKRVLFNVFIITAVQRMMYYMITYCVTQALGIDCSWIDVVAIQLMLSMAVDALPLPGAAGANEIVFNRLQKKLFGPERLASGLLLNRGITYYLLALTGGVISLIGHIWVLRRKVGETPNTPEAEEMIREVIDEAERDEEQEHVLIDGAEELNGAQQSSGR